MQFSLKVFFDVLDSYPEAQVMSIVQEQYDVPTKGQLFNEKFIPMSDLLIMGYPGFKKLLYNLLDTRPEFIEACLAELRALTLTLKGNSNYDY